MIHEPECATAGGADDEICDCPSNPDADVMMIRSADGQVHAAEIELR